MLHFSYFSFVVLFWIALFIAVGFFFLLFFVETKLSFYSDDHWANKSEASAWPSDGAILPTSIHIGAGAHRRAAAPRVVGTSPRSVSD